MAISANSVTLTMMAHPSRRAFVERFLLPAIGDPVWISWDVGDWGGWEQWKRCANYALAQDTSHFVILQDDIFPCRDFKASIEAALVYRANVPFSVFQVYYKGPRASRTAKRYLPYHVASEAGLSWARMDFMGAPAVVFPTHFWAGMQTWVEARHAADNEDFWQGRKGNSRIKFQIDWRLCRYLAHIGEPCWVTIPSLVQHLGSRVSLMNIVLQGEQIAYSYIGASRSGLEIDWSKGA